MCDVCGMWVCGEVCDGLLLRKVCVGFMWVLCW